MNNGHLHISQSIHITYISTEMMDKMSDAGIVEFHWVISAAVNNVSTSKITRASSFFKSEATRMKAFPGRDVKYRDLEAKKFDSIWKTHWVMNQR